MNTTTLQLMWMLVARTHYRPTRNHVMLSIHMHMVCVVWLN